MDAFEKDTKILFVGDTDQLQSVTPGNVLSDMIHLNPIQMEPLLIHKYRKTFKVNN